MYTTSYLESLDGLIEARSERVHVKRVVNKLLVGGGVGHRDL